jgi:hypothetical protein
VFITLNRIAPSLPEFSSIPLCRLGVELKPLFRRTLVLGFVGVLGAIGVLEAVELVGEGGANAPSPDLSVEGKRVVWDEE